MGTTNSGQFDLFRGTKTKVKTEISRILHHVPCMEWDALGTLQSQDDMGEMEHRNSTIFVFFVLSDSSHGVWSRSDFFPIVSPSTHAERAAERVVAVVAARNADQFSVEKLGSCRIGESLL